MYWPHIFGDMCYVLNFITGKYSTPSPSNCRPQSPQKTGGHSNLLFVLALLPVIGLGVAIYLCARRANYWKGNAAIATAGGLGLITIAAALMVVITPIIFCLRYLYQLLRQLPAHCCGSSHQIEI
ncbi:putative membrane associated protein [Chlamydia trachomatis]|nr:hypothetical protein SOTONE4_00308 [Chlamydia trachomatis E/SotonE4]CCP56053.1 hypothetical protein SOTONE8_00314 [Chlamydia trachomatis E/SotonE8]CCP60546.1 hypothetical protein BOUR_00312 [Chlamydia trachomatis E/Bour]CPR44870.1 putative membrane associated protein [Chlamydia trachomatis]CPR65316.1 putative membrane associated protein [Chlamydia trachomatis]